MVRSDVANAATYATGNLLWALGASIVAPTTVLALVLAHYGAPRWMIGGISGVQEGGAALPQLIGVYLFRNRWGRKRRLVLWHLCCVIPFGLLSAALAGGRFGLPDKLTALLVLASFAGYITMIGVIVAVWVDWIAHLFRQSIRGTVLGIGLSAASLGSTAGSLLAGTLIAAWPEPQSFERLYLIAAGFWVVSMFTYNLVRDPADAPEAHPEPQASPRVFARFRQSLADQNFRRYLIGRILASIGFCILPFITINFVSERGGSLRPGMIVAFSALQTLCSAIVIVLLGRLGDRRGHRIGAVVGASMQVATLLVLLFGYGVVGCLLAFAGAGVCIGANSIAHYNLLIETCPHDSRVEHVTVANLVLSPVLIFAPLLGGWIAGQFSLSALFTVSLVFSGLALAAFILLVKEPRSLRIVP